MSPILFALRELAGKATRPLVLWAARWIDARHPWAGSVLCREEVRAAARRARGCVPWSPR